MKTELLSLTVILLALFCMPVYYIYTSEAKTTFDGGGYRSRTDDPLRARQVL
jgi:hypothetical protein